MEKHLPDERLVFVDLETAGLETWRPIIQIAAIAVDSNLNELERFEAKLIFERKFVAPASLRKSAYASKIWKSEAIASGEGLRRFSKLLRRHATVDQVASDGRPFRVAQLVAHNGVFDGDFLRAWFNRFDAFLPASPRVFCTLQRAMWLFHEDKSLSPPPDFKLQTLCHYFGVQLRSKDAHDALNDVQATVELCRAMADYSSQRTDRKVAACG